MLGRCASGLGIEVSEPHICLRPTVASPLSAAVLVSSLGNVMKINTMSAIAALSTAFALLALPAGAAAVTFTNTVGGDTTGTGPYTLTSTDSTFSVLRFVNNETFNFADLISLQLTYDAQQGGVGGGTPRIAVVTDANHDGVADGDFLITLGPAGSFADPSLGVHSTGNLLAQNDLGRYDLSDIGGSFYTTYADALATAGSFGVLRFSILVDSFGGADRTFVIGADGVTASTGAALPEPASWALMILGFGVAGATLRRRSLTAQRSV